MLKKIAGFFLINEKELPQVNYFLVLFVLLGTGLALGRGSADALFFKRYGIEHLPMMYLMLSVALCLSSVIYAAIADRISGEKIFRYLFITVSTLLIINWGLMSFTDLEVVYPIYYLTYEIASEIFIIHTAHYLSQNLLLVQSKRLAPLVMAGTQVGVIIGGIFLANISHLIDIQNILLIWCLIMALSAILIHRWHRKYGVSLYFRPSPKIANKMKQTASDLTKSIRLMKSSKLLKALSFALFFMVITVYILIYSVNVIYAQTFQTEGSLSSFFGVLTAVNGTLALLLQVFVTNRTIRKFGAKKVKLWFPAANVISYTGLLLSFTFPFALLASFTKDVIMNAFRNPVRGIIFNAIPENIRGRARATALLIVMPLALSVCGTLLLVMQTFDNPEWFVGLGLAAALAYFAFANRVNKAYVEEIVEGLKRSLMMPSGEEISSNGNKNIESELLFKYLSQSQINVNNEFSKVLIATFPNEAPKLLLRQLGESDNAKTDKLIKMLSPLDPPGFKSQLWPILAKADDHLFATVLDAVIEPDTIRVQAALENALQSTNPRIITTGIKGIIVFEYAELARSAIQKWEKLLDSDNVADQIAVLEIVRYVHNVPYEAEKLIEGYRQVILSLLKDSDSRLHKNALSALQDWPSQSFTDIAPSILQLYKEGDTNFRLQCINASALLSRDNYQTLTMLGLNDSSERIREAAVRVIFQREENSIDLLTGWLTSESKGSFRAQKAMIEILHENRVPAGEMAKVILWKTRQLEEIQEALDFVIKTDTGGDTGLKVLRYTLAEKRDQLVDLLLMALRSFESPDIISVIQYGINSKDPRYLAQAWEVLRHMKNKQLATILGDILENLDRNNWFCKLRHVGNFTSLEKTLLWCQKQSDPWLSSCATQLMKQATVLA